MIQNNYLITGIAGFIGSHITEELLKNPQNVVIGIDNFYSGKQENIDYLKEISANRLVFVDADIRDFDKMNEVIKIYSVKYIFHEAAIASVQTSIENPRFTNAVNVQGTLNVLEAARLNGVEKVVFASSAAVYGDEPSLPKNENSVIKPISPYGYEKYMGEQYLKLYAELYGLKTVALRYFNVYGPRQDPSSEYSGVISIFENKIKNGEQIKIFGDGEQYRDFIFVKDVVKANLAAMEEETGPFSVFCVGTAHKTSVNELVKTLQVKYSKNIDIKHEDARKGDIKESLADNTKLITELSVQISDSLMV